MSEYKPIAVPGANDAISNHDTHRIGDLAGHGMEHPIGGNNLSFVADSMHEKQEQ